MADKALIAQDSVRRPNFFEYITELAESGRPDVRDKKFTINKISLRVGAVIGVIAASVILGALLVSYRGAIWTLISAHLGSAGPVP